MASAFSVLIRKIFPTPRLLKRSPTSLSNDTFVILLFMFKSLRQLNLCLIVLLDYSLAYICLGGWILKKP